MIWYDEVSEMSESDFEKLSNMCNAKEEKNNQTKKSSQD